MIEKMVVGSHRSSVGRAQHEKIASALTEACDLGKVSKAMVKAKRPVLAGSFARKAAHCGRLALEEGARVCEIPGGRFIGCCKEGLVAAAYSAMGHECAMFVYESLFDIEGDLEQHAYNFFNLLGVPSYDMERVKEIIDLKSKEQKERMN